ncbi:MAG TPA: hypothetical protein VIM98_08365 [Dyella sp.]|uniref:hypothetical protein n=1 Tax=Dyella sp. TaxID=1869338 RepID=UPI002F9599ED
MTVKTTLLSLLFCGLPICSTAAWAASSPLLDKPVREIQLPLPPPPDVPDAKPMLTCWYYSRFMIKQLDAGEKGASELAIVPFGSGRPEPVCRDGTDSNEHVIQDWSGYFWGVKGDYVLFHADDSVNGGMGFAVFSAASYRKLHTGIMSDHSLRTLQLLAPASTRGTDPRIALPPPALLMRYRSHYLAPCSLRSNLSACWGTIRRVLNLGQAAAPDCNKAYAIQEQQAPAQYKRAAASNPTVITYEAEAVIDGSGALRLSAASPTTKCFPAE